MKRALFTTSVASLLVTCSLSADPIITLFLKPYPELTSQEAHRESEKFKKPGKIAKRVMEAAFYVPGVAGVFVSYAGFLETSNDIGQISFPRKHAKAELLLFIADRPTPIIMFEQTVSHWELEIGRPAAAYRYERKKDQETDAVFWQVTPHEIAKDHRIPAESIIIFAKPQWVYIPTGITLAHDEPNLVLPDIYIKKGINLSKNASYLLYLIHLFGPVHPKNRRTETRITTQVVY